MEKIALNPGDIFCTTSDSRLSRAIRYFQGLWSLDGKADFTHAGVITTKYGDTIESVTSGVQCKHVSDYAGRVVIIGRHKHMTPEKFDKGLFRITQELGDIYPGWRLILHTIPLLAKAIASGRWFVCSELVALFLKESVEFPGWAGITPDYLADAIQRWRVFDEVAAGVMGIDFEI